jgi:predicted RNA-binding protein YlxR (DUF448 family)
VPKANIERLCVVCRQLKPRQQMVRLTVDHLTMQVVHNPVGQYQGRSAYVCGHATTPGECLALVIHDKRQRKRLGGALKRPIPDAIVSTLSSSTH